MAGFEKAKQDLEAVGAKVVAASIDPLDKASEVAAELSFAVAYGVTRETADRIGAWWEDRRGIIQPSEFVVGASGKVMAGATAPAPSAASKPPTW